MSFPPNSYGTVQDVFASYNRSPYTGSDRQTSDMLESSNHVSSPSEPTDLLESVEGSRAEGHLPRRVRVLGQDSASLQVLRTALQSAIGGEGLGRARMARETTPLLRKATSDYEDLIQKSLGHPDALDAATVISTPVSSDTMVGRIHTGKSTYMQTLFNCVAVLLGIGMLSEPLAFAYAGWFWGTILIIFFGIITCYTAKILAHEILDDPTLRSYTDIGRKAFGPKSSILTNFLFCLDLFALSVILVTLAADSLAGVWPAFSPNIYKISFLLVLVPTVFMPLSILSLTSLLGIGSMLFVVAVMFVDGFSKPDSPGSLWTPAPTSFSPGTFGELGVACGLLMAGFAGHVIIPSLACDMKDPSQFDDLANQAFFITTFIYAIIGGAGYYMFGKSVSDEISRNLLATPGYNPTLNQLVMWSLVITPLTKFALSTRPLNTILESAFGLEMTSPMSVEDGLKAERQPYLRHRILTAVERITIPVLSVLVSILVPQFCSMMAFLGSFCAFVMCVIGPVSAKIALSGQCRWYDGLLLGVSSLMAVWGTISAFWMA